MADVYGIPAGGDPYPGKIKYWAGVTWQLTWAETVAFIAQAGWPEDKWATAAAVASVECDRKPLIYNTYKSGHFGFFQISRSAWPGFFAQGAGGHAFGWMNPAENAKQAYAIYQKQGWGAWQAYTNGAYAGNLLQAKAAAAQVKKDHAAGKAYTDMIRTSTMQKIAGAMFSANPQAISDAVGSAVASGASAGASGAASGVVAAGDATASAVANSFGWLTDFWTAITTPAFWMRVAYGTTGVILITGGLFLIVSRSPATQKVAQTAMKVAV